MIRTPLVAAAALAVLTLAACSRDGAGQRAGVWSAGRIPAVLDGEPVRLASTAKVEWRPKVARILAPPPEPAA